MTWSRLRKGCHIEEAKFPLLWQLGHEGAARRITPCCGEGSRRWNGFSKVCLCSGTTPGTFVSFLLVQRAAGELSSCSTPELLAN
jgi:hypothetical protein